MTLRVYLEKYENPSPNQSNNYSQYNGMLPQIFNGLTTTTLAKASRDIPGYTAKTVTEDPNDHKVPVRVEDDQPEAYNYNFTYHYVKTPAKPDQPATIPDTSSTTPAESTNSESTSESGTEPATGTPVAVKGEAVTATKKIGLYRHATFTKANRLHWYAKQARTQRPQFVVTGYAHSKNGLLRYQVRDVNHTAKTDGQRGYITAKDTYVTPTYYQKQPTTVRVISPRGINAYRHVDLSGRATQHYRRGSVLKIKGIERHHLTTRLVLANGHYITGNKTLVIKK
ncbi:DUF5776 domain-containing protein [Levilactobacillus suantsaiihabitans]|uniref:DUF5776 domain-containing protein n=1 Tax=Levilactobacillus suantsaiihabitans TaxID=2487722 RepID=A0A4Z0JDV2_9LACO|nr:DUF5776 domain-containing protein [Levilactobacillus suantsaiihabitans]TGD19928.1 hypothetical protein EGT51_01690 [Levilactobacillus suantsaiihabitans]